MAATLRNFEVDLGLEQLWKLKKNAVYALAYRKLSNGGWPFEIQPLKKFFKQAPTLYF